MQEAWKKRNVWERWLCIAAMAFLVVVALLPSNMPTLEAEPKDEDKCVTEFKKKADVIEKWVKKSSNKLVFPFLKDNPALSDSATKAAESLAGQLKTLTKAHEKIFFKDLNKIIETIPGAYLFDVTHTDGSLTAWYFIVYNSMQLAVVLLATSVVFSTNAMTAKEKKEGHLIKSWRAGSLLCLVTYSTFVIMYSVFLIIMWKNLNAGIKLLEANAEFGALYKSLDLTVSWSIGMILCFVASLLSVILLVTDLVRLIVDKGEDVGDVTSSMEDAPLLEVENE